MLFLRMFGHLCRRNTYSTKHHRLQSNRARMKLKRTSTSSQHNTGPMEEIIIPHRIERQPTDILTAIASSIKKDYNSPHYKYIDDPDTIPASTISKKAYSLAAASGRRAAQYVISQHPQYFRESYADPSIEALMPPTAARLAEDTVEGLEERVALRFVEEAFSSYEKCRQAGHELPENMVLDLLDLLCVYNSENPKEALLTEERDFRRLLTQDGTRDKISNTWKDNGAAELVFKNLDSPSKRAYCSLIKGCAKYYQVDAANELFKKMREEGLKPDLSTYNAMIKLAGFVQNRLEGKIAYIKELLTAMQQEGIQPTIETFNNALATFPRSVRFNPPLVSRFTSSILNEMLSCGIEPSPATWNYVIRIIYFEDDSQSGVLEEIINRLEDTDLQANHPDDLEFFSMAMLKCSMNLKDLELTYRIHNLLNHGQNYKLIGDNFREGLYYNFFMKTLCMFEQIDTIMEHFEKIVPHSFVPTFTALDELFEAIQLNEGYCYLPKIWSDVHAMGYDRSLNILEKVAALMAKKKHPDPLQQQIYSLIYYSYESMLGEVDFLEEKDRLSQTDQLPMTSAPLLSYMCQISLMSGEAEQAEDIFRFYVEHKLKIRGSFLEETTKGLADVFIKRNDFSNLLEVLTIMSSFAHASIEVTAERMKEEMELTEEEKCLVDELL